MSMKTLLAASALIVTAPAAIAQTLSPNPAYTPYSATPSRYQPAMPDPNIATRYEGQRQTTITSPYAGTSMTTTTTAPASAIPYAPAPAYSVAPSNPYAPQTLDQQWQARSQPAMAPTPYAAAPAMAPSYAPQPMAMPATTPPIDASTAPMNWEGSTAPSSGPNDSLFISGGVGMADREHFKAVAGNYNVKVQMSTASGEFVSDVDFKVTDLKSNGTVFQTSTNGPLLMAKLQPGKYRIDATKFGTTKSQTITVGSSGTKNVNVFWNNA